MILDARFRGHDAREITDFFNELLTEDTRIQNPKLIYVVDDVKNCA